MDVPNHQLQDWTCRYQQLFDSALPTGAYAHSQGLEGLVQDGWLRDSGEVAEFIAAELGASLVNVELPIVRESHLVVRENKYPEIQYLDELAGALRPTRELRQFGSRTGRQVWRLYSRLFDEESREKKRLVRCQEFLSGYQSSVCLGLLSAIMEIPLQAALAGFAQQVVTGCAQTCIKLLNAGPTECQQIIFTVSGQIPAWVAASHGVGLEDCGFSVPLWDIASSRHQFAEQRLYIS